MIIKPIGKITPYPFQHEVYKIALAIFAISLVTSKKPRRLTTHLLMLAYQVARLS